MPVQKIISFEYQNCSSLCTHMLLFHYRNRQVIYKMILIYSFLLLACIETICEYNETKVLGVFFSKRRVVKETLKKSIIKIVKKIISAHYYMESKHECFSGEETKAVYCVIRKLKYLTCLYTARWNF